jgi:UDP-N-acetylmuramate--alanine ligase
VIEADEYDRSFLKLSPDIAVISAMDPDHLDIYGTAEEMEDAYIRFVRKIRLGGLLLSKKGLKRESELVADKHKTYALNNEGADVYTDNLRVENGSYVFDLVWQRGILEGLQLNVGGLHNVENIVAASAVALHLGIDEDKVRAAIASYKGVKRRFEYIVREEKAVYIDDYAHHPEELRSLITSAKMLYPRKRVVVIFQPHLFTRTRDLADGFAGILDVADEVLLLPIYPARELPIEGVTSRMISDRMRNCETGRSVHLLEKDEVLQWIRGHQAELGSMVLITAGAGDIDRLTGPIKNIITG